MSFYIVIFVEFRSLFVIVKISEMWGGGQKSPCMKVLNSCVLGISRVLEMWNWCVPQLVYRLGELQLLAGTHGAHPALYAVVGA